MQLPLSPWLSSGQEAAVYVLWLSRISCSEAKLLPWGSSSPPYPLSDRPFRTSA